MTELPDLSWLDDALIASGCDYGGGASIYINWKDKTVTCRCMVCARCNHHTGNSHQGHYWKFCKVTKHMEEFHFCCPGDCEIYGGAGLNGNK
jgi:hypothetical protein